MAGKREILTDRLVGLDKVILKLTGKCKELGIAKTLLNKNEKEKRKKANLLFQISNIKSHSKVTMIKTVWYWPKHAQFNQWNRKRKL